MKFNAEKMQYIRLRVIGISQKRLAEITGVSFGYIQKLEQETRKNPSFSVVTKIAAALKVKPQDLFIME